VVLSCEQGQCVLFVTSITCVIEMLRFTFHK
jgi:hypothetical protein